MEVLPLGLHKFRVPAIVARVDIIIIGQNWNFCSEVALLNGLGWQCFQHRIPQYLGTVEMGFHLTPQSWSFRKKAMKVKKLKVMEAYSSLC